MPKTKILEMYEWYMCGLSCQKIGDKFGIERRMVHYFFKREGLKMRGGSSVKEDHQEFNGKIFTCRADKKVFRMTTGKDRKSVV